MTPTGERSKMRTTASAVSGPASSVANDVRECVVTIITRTGQVRDSSPVRRDRSVASRPDSRNHERTALDVGIIRQHTRACRDLKGRILDSRVAVTAADRRSVFAWDGVSQFVCDVVPFELHLRG